MNRRAGVGAVSAVAVFASLLLPGVAPGDQGRLDRAFGKAGISETPLEGARKGAIEVGVGPDGSAVVGDPGGYVVRFESSGALDTGFGDGGRLSFSRGPLDEGSTSRVFRGGAFAVDGEGRVLEFGGESEDGTLYKIPGTVKAFSEQESTPESEAVVLRFDQEGRPDPSFGGGTGFARSSFGVRSEFQTTVPLVTALTGAVDSQDRPVLVIGGAAVGLGCHAGAATYYPRGVVRLTQAGDPDRSFGTEGVAAIGGSSDLPELKVDSRGRSTVWVGPYPQPRLNCNPGTALVRLRADGERVGGFGHHGSANFAEDFHLAFVGPSGATFLAESSGRILRVARIGHSGHRDRAFGSGGMVSLRLPVGARVEPTGVDTKGRILLTGFIGAKGQGHASLVVGRLLPDGRGDRSFGTGGWLVDRVPGPVEVGATAATLDPRGRLLLAATITSRGQAQGGYLLARYLLGS